MSSDRIKKQASLPSSKLQTATEKSLLETENTSTLQSSDENYQFRLAAQNDYFKKSFTVDNYDERKRMVILLSTNNYAPAIFERAQKHQALNQKRRALCLYTNLLLLLHNEAEAKKYFSDSSEIKITGKRDWGNFKQDTIEVFNISKMKQIAYNFIKSIAANLKETHTDLANNLKLIIDNVNDKKLDILTPIIKNGANMDAIVCQLLHSENPNYKTIENVVKSYLIGKSESSKKPELKYNTQLNDNNITLKPYAISGVSAKVCK